MGRAAMIKSFLTVLVLVAIAAGVFTLGYYGVQPGGQPILHVAEEVPLTVNTALPERQGIVRLVQAPGDVEAVLEVDISSEIVAKIVEMPVEEGDVVKKGDLLCRLNDEDLRAQVESGKARVGQLTAAIAQAEADAEKAKRDLDRQAELSERAATSDLEMRDYLTVHKRAVAVLDMRRHELIEAEAFLRRAQEDLEKTVIRSPIDGVIATLAAKEGEVVITGTMNNPGTVIMTISDLSKMQVRARVDEVDVPLVKSGQEAKLYLQADQNVPVPARVVRVASKGTKQQGRDVVTFETLLEVLSDDPRVKPGMSCNVEVEVAKSDDALTVPVEAVVHRMRKELPEGIVKAYDERQASLELSERAKQAQYIKVVYVMADGKAQVRLIEPGIADSRHIELKSGVAPEDTVIIGPYRSLDQLKEGRSVKITEEEAKQQAAEAEAKVASADNANDNAGDQEPADGAHDDAGAEEADNEEAARIASGSGTP